MDRPNLDKNIAPNDFNDFYWLKEELVTFCKEVGLDSSGGKLEIANRIVVYLQHGQKVVPLKTKRTTAQSTFDWSKEKLSMDTVITDNYRNTEHVRVFFSSHCAHFKFNVLFMDWMKANHGKTLGEAINKWHEIRDLKKDKNHRKDIAPQFEYNRYMRAFLADNPDLTSRDAMKFWKLKRRMRGAKSYDPSDLKLIE